MTPLGRSPKDILRRIGDGESVAVAPCFDASPFYCPVCAPVPDFDAEAFFPDNKTLRLMNRDAQMAVVAARLAMQDAGLSREELEETDIYDLCVENDVLDRAVDEVVAYLEERGVTPRAEKESR